MQPQEPADIWKPALIAGSVFGVASALPWIGALNCACCSLVVGAGLVSSFMMVKGTSIPVTWGRAALGGALAGMITALVSSMGQMLLTVARGRTLEENFNEAADRVGEILPNASEAAEMMASIPPLVFLAVTMVVSIVIYAPFGALGGVIGRALFEKRGVPPPAAPYPNTAPPAPPPTLDI